MAADDNGSAASPERPSIADLATSESRRKGALAAARVKRERAKSFRAKLAEKVDGQVEEVYGVFAAAMKADIPPTVITHKDGTVVEKGGGPDHATRYKAAAALVNQAFGNPAIALTGPDGGPLGGADVERLAEEFLANLDRLVARQQAVPLEERIARMRADDIAASPERLALPAPLPRDDDS